uniref:hypothetical protein n=1 Tax=Endozoicomonas sp. SESOKO1 TaxID=2828742 RepID=UPI0021481C23
CLRGLPLNGHRVTPDAVARDFPDTPEGKLGLARFKAECCLRGLRLNNQPVTVEIVVKDYQANRAALELARFMEQCCLKGLLFNGQLVTPEIVVKCFQQTRATLELVRFKEQCCLRGLSLNGFQVTPDEVAGDLQAVRAPLELARFMEQCCLKGWLLHGQPVTPETVDMGYERGGWLLERAYFYSRLALNARELNGSYLDNRSVLAAFDEAPGNHASRQAEYLMQRLGQSRGYDETDEAQDIIEKAWQIVDNVSVRDEQRRLQCLLKFMAMQNQLAIDHQGVSAEQVLQSIKTLRHSYQNLRIHFFFLAHCHITRQFIDGQKIHKEQVLDCLRQFPEGSKLRHALGRWFEQCGSEVNVMDTMLLNSGNRFNNAGHGDRSHLPDVIPRTESTGRPAKSAEVSVANPFPRLNALVLKTLEIIQEINSSFSHPPILITGSYARFLQHRCSSFNDIDIICTVTESAKTLFAKLQVLNTGRDSEIPQNITIWPVPGCQEINLPKAYNINLKDGDLGMKTMGFQVSVDNRVTHGNEARLAVHVPGVERPVWHLSFAEETRLLNDTLEYLADNLDLLTELLQTGMLSDIPRTILFNAPKNTGDRIYGLLMRCLLTLNKARQFIVLHSDGKPEDQTQQLQKEQQRLHALTESLQKKLSSHACRNDFVDRVNGWLSTAHHFNEYEIKRKEFIKALLALIQPEQLPAADQR